MSAKKRDSSEFKLWERILLVIALLLFLICGGFYVTDFPLRKYLFGIDDEAGLIKVGDLAAKNGSLRRQLSTEGEFKNIDIHAPLYNFDVLVTGPESGASLHFDDGGTVSLEPNTMVKIAFLNQFGLKGINRLGRVEVIVGAATGNMLILRKAQPVKIARASPKPTPSPSPSPSPKPTLDPHRSELTKVVSPKGNHLKVEKGSQVPKMKVALQWKVAPADAVVLVTAWKLSGKTKSLLHKGVVQAKDGKGSETVVIDTPGDYEWQITGSNGEAITTDANSKARFVVDQEFEGIPLPDQLIGGKKDTDNSLKGDLIKDFDIVLKWQTYPKASSYQLWFGKSATDPKPLLERTLTNTEFSFNKKKVFAGQVYFKISTRLPSGFIATTGVLPFSFNFLPPILVVPEANAVVTHAAVVKEDNSLLFTWTKTNFTEGYEIEISRDAAFTKPFVKQLLKENFYVLSNPEPGSYWWRARSFTKETSSRMSNSNPFVIQQ